MNEDVVNAYFTSEDAKLILQIPLSRRYMDDKLIWILDPLGQFTVKFAYVVARIVLGNELLESYRSPLWKVVWQAKVLPKIKYFI